MVLSHLEQPPENLLQLCCTKTSFCVVNMNASNEDADETASRQVQIHVLLALSLLVIAANTTVILIIVRKRVSNRSLGNIDRLILQLAVSDLLVGFLCLAADAIWKYTYWWLAGNYACKLYKFMQMFSLYCSTYTIVTVAIDRCIAIKSTCTLTKSRHRRATKIMSLCACIVAFVFGLPQVFVFRTAVSPFKSETGYYEQCVTHGAYTRDWQELAYILFTCVAMFILPLIIIVISYILIFKKIHDESQWELRGETSKQRFTKTASCSSTAGERRDMVMKNARTKALCVSVIVIGTFVVCWAPYYACVLYYVLADRTLETNNSALERIFQVVFFFGMSNSVVNPLIYGAFHMAKRSRTCGTRWYFTRRAASFTGSYNTINADNVQLRKQAETMMFTSQSRAYTFAAHTTGGSFIGDLQVRRTSLRAVKSSNV